MSKSCATCITAEQKVFQQPNALWRVDLDRHNYLSEFE